MTSRKQWVLSALAVPLALSAGYVLAGNRQAPVQQNLDRPATTQQNLGTQAAAQRRVAAPGKVAEYPSMTALRMVEQSGTAYDLNWTVTRSPLIVVAPHGGNIEVRTSEIAAAIAGNDHTQCQFRGKLPAGQNARLHVTSENWDVKECLILIGQRTHALSIHGTAKEGKKVYIGGRDTTTGAELETALRTAGFDVVRPAPADIGGTSPDNFVNKDADGAGVQFELTRELRDELFPTEGGPISARGQKFVDTVRGVYAQP
ncbi:poly-gamma-glutamate hydrolase family protein [Couchioplanes caeruleus]|uniref:Phage replication-related protein YjqB (UPF0714/DUF867 family) n=2 Tax=Couchioplanes caeruleus TaxID=56438 RepID=A0A1K0FR69_9ACTN|nr:poly-gamma-glutamate hydrolase family protein [Couchioplanes caeruleus]OJF15289.1 hypothetical protein BG844_05360 [Couchioplanes caeruleus subsp. caeruleus]ROP30810.1 phage replication-related protein YjqB (UPF0714/DUF867 family) [Couchioplanes caeruleus]